MKLIVAVVGGRDFTDYEKMCRELDKIEIDTVVSGGANGADKLAKRYAKERNLEYIEFLPKWDKFGMSAGYQRNVQIVDASQMVVAFWNGSKGTKLTIDITRKQNKPLKVISY